MKKRVPVNPSTDHSPPKRGAARPRVRPQAKRKVADDYGYPDTHFVVTEEQFQFLLDLLEKPPEVSEALRREVANRRWK